MNSPKQKRNFTSQFKTRIVLEHVKGIKSQSEICREHAICPSLFSKWKTQFEKNAPLIFEDNKKKNQEIEKIEKLERIIGKQTVELDFLKRGLQTIGT